MPSLFFKVFTLFFAVFMLSSQDVRAESARLMVFGDSLVAGYGLPLDQAFPAQLEKKLVADGKKVTVINAGVSGDTTAGGLARIDWAMQQKPTHIMVVLGGNDMLRAIEPKVTEKNLRDLMEKIKASKTPVLLAGMKSFRNLGGIFGSAYDKMYKGIAKDFDAVYYPFFLDGIAFDTAFNQDDGIHPNMRGVAEIVDRIYPSVEKLLKKKS